MESYLDEYSTVRMEKAWRGAGKEEWFNVFESHGPNIATCVFTGPKDKAQIILDAFVSVGYRDITN